MLSEKLLEALMCPVCGGRPLKLLADEPGNAVIVEGELACPDCKRRYPVRDDIPRMMPPDLASNLSAFNERWEDWGEAMRRFLRWRDEAWGDHSAAVERRATAREMHEAFIAFSDLPHASEVLDVGSGTGHAADLLPEEACYVGIDPLVAGAAPDGEMPSQMPRPARPVSLVQGVGEDLPFADSSFDAVLLMGTLDHARDPEEMLSHAARVLRPSGVLGVLQGISTAPSGGLGGLLRSVVKSFSAEQGPNATDTHLHRFTSADDVADLIATHLDVLDATERDNRAFIRATRPSAESEGEA